MPALRNSAERFPEKIACVIAGTETKLTYAELDERANSVAQLLMWMGLSHGDGIAIMLDNDLTYFELVWGAMRGGIYYTPISTHLKPEEAAYIIQNCGAKTFFTKAKYAEIVEALLSYEPVRCSVFVVGGTLPGCMNYEQELAKFDRYLEIPEGPVGKDFFYSSGTTGKPKGIKQPLFADAKQFRSSGDWVRNNFKINADTIYLSPAPLYHGAPLRFSMRTLDCGGTVVVMRKFAPEAALEALETFSVTHSQWVPTMFFRLLALPGDVRTKYDLSSHVCAIHSAAPCPAEIKERMIAWWGPIVWEYYSSSERNGVTCISPKEWLERKGSVGRAVLGTIHILDDELRELGPREVGDIYFDGPEFVYHNDPERTAQTRDSRGWTTVGDVGYLDEDGFLFLTDRRSHMIISGGVNIYPAEIENHLSLHPDIEDVAVFGIPNLEYGEEVSAVVQLKDPAKASDSLAESLIEYCRNSLSNVKCPRSVYFETSMPRYENGKLFKHALKKRYVKP